MSNHLEEDDPIAQAMQYTHVSQTEGQNCKNCVLYIHVEGEDQGPCQIFPGKFVAHEGWCTAWVRRS